MCRAEMLREKARENLSRAGGDKINTKPPLSKSPQLIDAPVHVRKSIADEAGVSEGTMHNYMEVTKQAPPSLLNAVKSGKLRINTAHRLLDKEIKKQLAIADQKLRFIEQNYPLKGEGSEAANQAIREQLMELLTHLNALKEAHNA